MSTLSPSPLTAAPRPPQCPQPPLSAPPTPKPRARLPSGHSAPPTALLGLGAPWLASWGGAPRDLSLARPPPVSVLPNLGIFLQTPSQFPVSTGAGGSLGPRLSETSRRVSFLLLLPPQPGASPRPPGRWAGPLGMPPPEEKGPASTVGTCVGGGGRLGRQERLGPRGPEPRGAQMWASVACPAYPGRPLVLRAPGFDSSFPL